jgi:hypothetical protein
VSRPRPDRHDRDHLIDSAERYLNTLVIKDPSRLPLAPEVRFTENGQELALGRGLWATIKGRYPGGRHFTDPTAGQVVWWGAVTEMERSAILALRLKIDKGLIAEIETLVVREGCPVFAPSALAAPRRTFHEEVESSRRPLRQDLVRAANLYLDGIERDDPSIMPVADDCVRIENGVQTTLEPSSDRDPRRLGVVAQVAAGYTRHIEAARDRRFSVVDEERGLVLCHFFFDHPGNVATVGGRIPFGYPNSMMVWELFQVREGRIVAIEAVLDVFPYGMPTSWPIG